MIAALRSDEDRARVCPLWLPGAWHGVQADSRVYCCAHCARKGGVEGAHDNTDRS